MGNHVSECVMQARGALERPWDTNTLHARPAEVCIYAPPRKERCSVVSLGHPIFAPLNARRRRVYAPQKWAVKPVNNPTETNVDKTQYYG